MPKSADDNTVIISCEEDERSCAEAIANGIPIVSSEFVLTGLLQQRADIEKYPFSLHSFFISRASHKVASL